MRPLHIIMPMAGEGSRFIAEGWKVPKPLITLDGKYLFQWAISSVGSIDAPVKFSFIVRAEHIANYKIDEIIMSEYPGANVFQVGTTTRGAVETCLLAKGGLSTEDAILILDCDLYFYSDLFNENILSALRSSISEVNGGGLVSFDSTNPRYSYAELNEFSLVSRTAEKDVISNNALCGAYFFSKAQSFIDASNMLMNDLQFDRPEFYVSLLYNYLLSRGEVVWLAKTTEYRSYGTPNELAEFL